MNFRFFSTKANNQIRPKKVQLKSGNVYLPIADLQSLMTLKDALINRNLNRLIFYIIIIQSPIGAQAKAGCKKIGLRKHVISYVAIRKKENYI